jgi:hypothetical protein
MRTLVTAALVCLLGLGAAGLGLGAYARRHFLPVQHMNEALAAGDGCVLLLGDSRMAAAFDAQAFHRGLVAAGPDRCLAPLAIGATDVAGQLVTAREYLARGRRPAVAFLGIAGDSLLGPETPLRPEELVGNNVIHFEWTTPPDVVDEVPGFPLGDIATFDAGLRFLADQASPLGRYQSLVAVKTQALTGLLTGRAVAERNRFGALGDMAALESTLRLRAGARLEAALAGPEPERLGRWFPRTLGLLAERGARVAAVELPMPRLYRDTVTDRPQTIAYHAWLRAELARRGVGALDLAHAPFIDDALFADALHLGPAGAALVSEELGRFAGALLATSVAQPPRAP